MPARVSITIARDVAALALGVVALLAPASRGEEEARLNILFILIDDLGWADLGCYGNPVYATPNLDRLAGEGMRFTDAYAACPVCSPTRASILTGRYPARLHLTAHIPASPAHRHPENARWLNPRSIWELPHEEVTVAERLKAAGFATGFIGKWHISGSQKTREDPDQGVGKPEFYPESQGFDLNVAGCALGAPPSYFDPYGIVTLEDRREGEYLTDRLTEAAVDFIEANKEKPFFLYLSHYDVHTPMQAKADLEEKYRSLNHPRIKNPAYAAKVEAMDVSVGKVLESLEAAGVADRTVVVFFSDNGGLSQVTDNAPLREGKGYLYEGGIREPLIVKWPGVVEPGSVRSTPVSSVDFFPTFLDIAGLEADSDRALDGESLLPLLTETGSFPDRSLFWHYPHYSPQGSRLASAVREGDLKVIEFLDDGSLELYNLAKDIGESRDLAASDPETAGRLKKELDEWRESVGALMPPPNPDFDPSKPETASFIPAWRRK